MNLVEHMTGTLGSVESFSIAASAAAVAVGAVATDLEARLLPRPSITPGDPRTR